MGKSSENFMDTKAFINTDSDDIVSNINSILYISGEIIWIELIGEMLLFRVSAVMNVFLYKLITQTTE